MNDVASDLSESIISQVHGPSPRAPLPRHLHRHLPRISHGTVSPSALLYSRADPSMLPHVAPASITHPPPRTRHGTPHAPSQPWNPPQLDFLALGLSPDP
eukprot:scaffold56666_cov57-Phaeocystis_antarctica.AAC.6